MSEPIASVKAHSGPSETIIATPRQFAERFGLEGTKGYVHATALIRFLQEVGLAEQVGTEQNGSKKGKGAAMWKVPSQIIFNM